MSDHDATRRPQSRFAAGLAIPFSAADDRNSRPKQPVQLELPMDMPQPAPAHDPVNRPKHYTQHPSGVECIEITEHMGFNLGNATKYIWRADLKHDAIEDLRKAVWYIQREIAKRIKVA
jgi:hypothetical protein